MSMSLSRRRGELLRHRHEVGEDDGERGACRRRRRDEEEGEGASSTVFVVVVVTSLSSHVKEGG